MKKGESVLISSSTIPVLPCVKNIIPCGSNEKKIDRRNKTEYPSLLFIGDLRSRKNGDFLLKVFLEEVLLEIPNAILTVIGPEKCSGKNIIYKGVVDDDELDLEFEKSWLYCLPSSYEGFGVPIVEAYSSYSAVCMLKNRGSNEIVNNGITAEVSTKKMYGKSLIKVIKDSQYRESITVAGYNFFKEKFTILKITDQYEILYQKQRGKL
jgi:glycosyltransferase involved in cell wall biosynthesis